MIIDRAIGLRPNPGFTEIGIGIETGQFNNGSGELDSVMVSQNFAHTDAESVDPPTRPVDDVTTADDLREMFNDMFEGFGGVDSFVFASFGTVTNIEGRGALIHTESYIFIPEGFGSFQQIACPDDMDMAQVYDAQIPDTLNLESESVICGGFDPIFG